MNFSSRHSKGFSLLEVLLAVFIFSLIMVGVTTYFVGITRTNQNTLRLQRNLEDVRFAMNRVAKILRTATVVIPISDSMVSTVRAYDYSQEKCIEYAFVETAMRESVSGDIVLPDGTEKTKCESAANFSSGDIVSVANGATLSGKFSVVPSSAVTGSEHAGRVTINATITRQNTSSTIQTTVSLRNYQEINP